MRWECWTWRWSQSWSWARSSALVCIAGISRWMDRLGALVTWCFARTAGRTCSHVKLRLNSAGPTNIFRCSGRFSRFLTLSTVSKAQGSSRAVSCSPKSLRSLFCTSGTRFHHQFSTTFTSDKQSCLCSFQHSSHQCYSSNFLASNEWWTFPSWLETHQDSPNLRLSPEFNWRRSRVWGVSWQRRWEKSSPWNSR